MTLTIRMFLGVQYEKPTYFIHSLLLFILCFIMHIIKFIFRFLLTYFIFKNRDNISSLTDMNIIETKRILWIKGFDIKINGLWTIIIILIFMLYWLAIILLFESKKKYFNYVDEKEKEEYIKLINLYYEKQQQQDMSNQRGVSQVEIQNNN